MECFILSFFVSSCLKNVEAVLKMPNHCFISDFVLIRISELCLMIRLDEKKIIEDGRENEAEDKKELYINRLK